MFQPQVSCFNNFQGGPSAHSVIEWHPTSAIWLATYDQTINQIFVHECPNWTLTKLCNEEPSISDCYWNGNEFNEDLSNTDGTNTERSFSISADGTLVVGYPDYLYSVPSRTPSSKPSSEPSSTPSSEPSLKPTPNPTPNPTPAPTNARRLQVDHVAAPTLHSGTRRLYSESQFGIDIDETTLGLDYRGHAIIYQSGGYHANEWKVLNNFQFIGPIDDESFGECVAISENGNMVAISSPDNGSGLVYIFEKDDGVFNYIQRGADLVPPSSLSVSRFGKKIGLSADGSVVVIAADEMAFLYYTDVADETGSFDEFPFGTIKFNEIGAENFDNGVAIDSDNLIVYGKDDEDAIISVTVSLMFELYFKIEDILLYILCPHHHMILISCSWS